MAMRSSLRLVCVLCLSVACSKAPEPPPLVAETSGTIAVTGLSRPVRVVRDRWGVPHIYAESQDDLFVAQGLVQAQDRLFQMDLWKRASQGRLSQVLGANFIERDAMTRRFQYRGNLDAEWASYGDDTERIAAAFARGINAWVERARQRPPEEFVLAGWTPEFWTSLDVLSRTDAFLASGDALTEVARRNVSPIVAAAIRRVGTAPFLVALAAPVPGLPAADRALPESPAGEIATRPASAAGAAAVPGRLTFDELVRAFSQPSARYFVHLHAPGWNVVGATRPWLPGVAIGHNERIAWAPAPLDADTQDVYAEQIATIERTVTKEPIVVKGRRSPFVFDIEQTPRGIVVASDRERSLVFTLRWSGTEPGAAAELAALALGRAESWSEFRAALARWKMPVRRVFFADSEGNAGFQDAGLVPVRHGHDWAGWQAFEKLPHALNPRTPARSLTDESAVGSSSRPPDERVVFSSVLGVTAAARRRFDVGPLAPPAHDGPIRTDIDTHNWDESRGINAPGQSESPSSPHFRDLAPIWSAGEWMMLPFSDEAVRAAARETLTLLPRVPATSPGAGR
jgi:penicillin amidase